MARACRMRYGSNGVFLSFIRQFAITSSCGRRAGVATHLTISCDPGRVLSDSRGRNLFNGSRSRRLVAVGVAGLVESPDGPCHAGGKGDGHQLDRFALQHLPQPIFPCRPVAALGDLGECAKIQQPIADSGCPSWLSSPAFLCHRWNGVLASNRSSCRRRAFSTTRRDRGPL